MKSEVKVLLLGFAPFEKSTFESFFKLVARRDTFYKAVKESDAPQILLVNGDHPESVRWVQAAVKPGQKALFVGAPDLLGNWPHSPRPIKLTAVLGLLDSLDVAKPATPLAPALPTRSITPLEAPPPPKASSLPMAPALPKAPPLPKAFAPQPLPRAFVPARKNTVRQGSGTYDAGRTSGFGASNFMGLGLAPAPKIAEEHFDEILVVDDSDVALKFMQNRLTRYGFRSELVKSGEEALTRVSARSFKFVFLDVMMEGLDGYQTCRAIKQRKYTSTKPPVVVMLTSRGGSINKIRGGLAGCDAYLTKPLNEAELLKVLAKYDQQVERGFRDTNFGGNSSISDRSR